MVSSDDGMDEISLATTTQFAYVEDGILSRGIIDPQTLGFKLAPKEAILGGDAAYNAQITRDIFAGQERDAKRDIVVLNAGFALFVDGKTRDFQEAFEIARDGIDSGKAKKHLALISKISHNF